MSHLFLFDTLRAHLKARGMTYKQLSLGLGLSEQTVKRIFSLNDCTIERLDEICGFLQIEMAELIKSTPKKGKLIEQLSWEQESEIANNKKLLMMAVCVMTLWTYEDMVQHLTISKTECVTLLHKLEAIGFIEMHPQHRYRLHVARNFSWIHNGPIMQLVKRMSMDFFNHRFDAPGEVLKIINVRISKTVRESLKARLEQISQEYADQVAADSHLPLMDRPPLSICIAVREWVPEVLGDLLQKPDQAQPSTGAVKSRQPQKSNKTKL